MQAAEPIRELNTSYEPFSREPEYIEVNRLFIERLPLHARSLVLDLACGTGTVTALILETMSGSGDPVPADRAPGRGPSVVGIDLSRESLGYAQSYAGGARFACGTTHDLPLADGSVDAVVIGNAIQLFEDKERACREIHRVLQDGGLFAFNTSFYAGTYVPGTEPFYRHWIEHALLHVRTVDRDSRASGLPGVPRSKGGARRAAPQPWLSQAEYRALLERTGFEVRDVVERTVMLTQHSFETIGSYAGLAGVLLAGYPVALSCEALERAAGPALAAVGASSIPRYWIEFLAVKR